MVMKQALVVFGALAFLGTTALLAASAVTIAVLTLLGEKRFGNWHGAIANWLFGGRGLSRKILIAALALLATYSALLLAASLTSHEWTLMPGQEKYFCEIDCHLAYSVTDVSKATTIGKGVVPNRGVFYLVSVRTRFDENTISPHRGNAPLQPSPRDVTLIDGAGQSYTPCAEAMRVLEDSGGAGTVMTQPLRPGESYETRIVFDVPSNVRNLRLLIESPTEPAWLGTVLIGDESSLLHKHVFLALPS